MNSKTEHIPILRTENISKHFPGVMALDSVSIDFFQGQVNAIVGENGAGKSTLMNILSGVYKDYVGQLYLSGEPLTFENPRDAQNHGITIIHQELNLIPYLSCAENIFLGREFVNSTGFIDYRKLHTETRKLLQLLEIDIDPRTTVSNLRVGQQQLVEIAKALSYNARIIIMDEPTSAISEQEIRVLFRIIQQLVLKGVTIIYITHKLDELFEIAQHISIFRDGRLINSGLVSEFSQEKIVNCMVGRDLGNKVKEYSQPKAAIFRAEKIILKNPDKQRPPILDNINFSLAQGEVLGIFGLMGAGRTELLETIFGLHASYSSGDFYINETKIIIQSPINAIRAGIALVPEDRKLSGLIMQMNVAENISLASLENIENNGLLSWVRESELVTPFIKQLNIKTGLETPVNTLSGGNQQKVVIAKWLAKKPSVLLLDEPTRGIDIGAKQEIYRLIENLAKAGLGILMVSSELPEILALSDRILVMSQGKITAEFAPFQATEEKLLKAAI